MAVTQISKIQIRRGFQADIGNLAAGEFAWAIDTQRLFIGNGTTEEGAPINGITEIMTNLTGDDVNNIIANYVYKGFLGGYEVVTGPDSTSPVIRALQDKIDDFVNVRDFGAAGTGNVDDTEAIQRAMYELYDRFPPIISLKTKRKLRFNGGQYLIQGELKIPPYISIEGEGIDSVELILATTARLVTSTGDSASEELAQTEYPASINIKGLTFRSETNITLLEIDGSQDVVFEDVGFVGPLSMPELDDVDAIGLTLSSTSRPTSRILFNRCTFKKLSQACLIDSVFGTSAIEFNHCKFKELGNGITTEFDGAPNIPPSDIKVHGSVFEDIYGNAIFGDASVRGIVSLSNVYKNVASFYEGDETPVAAWAPIIIFNANNNYSISDIFYRTLDASKIFQRVAVGNYRTVTLSVDEYLSLGSAKYIPGNKQTLLANQGFSLRLETLIYHGIVNYSMTRENETRTGIIKFVKTDSGGIVFDDEYAESTDIGVQLFLITDPDNSQVVRLAGTVDDSIESNVTFCFDLKTLS